MAFLQSKTLASLILDEIGLEGLEGITISGLWTRLSESMQLPLPLLERFQNQVWNVIIQANAYFYFYELPEPREKLKLWNRFAVVDPDYGLPLTLTECPFNLYKSVPITDGEIIGSCENYDTRKPIAFDEIKTMTLKEIEAKWGDSFVIVGTQKLRYSCLIPPHISTPTEITSVQYCVLELVGRSRKNGISTAGKFSILHCCKDSAIGFYIRNKLIRLGLVIRQAYTEKRADRLISSSLLHLSRFYTQNKTAFTAVIEKMFFALKHTPNQRMSMSSLRSMFPPENHAMIKKIVITQFFRKFFDVFNVPAKELLEIKPSSKASGEREVICVKLKNPCLSEDELFNDDEKEEEKESNNADFYDYKHAYVDMPLSEEIYRAIEKFGSEGCSQSQLCANLATNHLNVRQALKKAIQQKIVTTYCKDMGRQRTNMIVAVSCANSVKKVKEDRANITKNLKCIDEPKLPPEPDQPPRDIKQITSTIKEKINKFKPTPRDITFKQVERQQKIINLVNDLCIIQMPVLRLEIIKFEQEAGYKDEICNKSIYRMVGRLQEQKIINMLEITLRWEENARIYRYVTHPKITPEHIIMHHEVLKLKNALFLYLEEKKCRAPPSRPGQTTKPKVQRVGLIPMGPQKSPKFLTARFLHEFMFYTLNELHPNREPITLTESLLALWVESEPNINSNDLFKSMEEDHIYPYRESINWKTFITPLSVYKDKPAGWIFFPDVVDRMPFSLLNKIIHVPPTVDKAAMEYILHPVRQHYGIKQLPLTLQSLINRNRLSRILCNIIQILQFMGLIQVSDKKGKDPIQFWVYLNRKATIVDTTPSEPGYLKINGDREYTKIDFNFKKMSDIKQYWNCLHKICLITKLGFVHKNVVETDSKSIYKQRRLALYDIVSPLSSFKEAPLLDTGVPPGDGLGAGGLASGLYSSFQRNWTWLVNNKHTAAAAAAAQKLKKQSTKYMRTRMSKLADETMLKKSNSVKKVTRLATTSTGKVVRRKKILTVKPRSKFPADSIDRDAIRQMRSLRARWCHKEDLILKMARATFLFLGVPVVHLNLRDVAKIARDIIRLQCGIHNKTTQACHRRIHFMVKTNRHLPELPQWLHAMQTNEHLTGRYDSENFYRDLKELYPVKTDFQNALAVHFLYAFNVLQTQHTQDEPLYKSNKKSNFPDTLTEFYKKYRECSPLIDDKALLYFNPTTRLDLQLATINNVLHSSLSCVRDKTQYNLQIFDIFKTYSEEVLHTAFKIARIDGLVVSRKKSQPHTYTTQMTGPSFVFSNKFRMSLMFLRFPCVVLDMLYAFFSQASKLIFSHEPAAFEIKSPHSGQLFFLTELLWHNAIVVDIKIPNNMLTIDPMAQQSNTSQSQKIMDHFHNILGNAPQTEYSKHFDSLGELATRVKFKAGNVKHKLNYNPFDVIAKMDSVQVHFFCFLGNLNRTVDIDFSKLIVKQLKHVNGNEDEKEDIPNCCPFSAEECVMKSQDYLSAIETIVKNKEHFLHSINEDIDMNGIECKNNLVTISVENILAIFENFRTLMKNHLIKEDAKDLGSIALSKKPLDLIEICQNILETCCDEVSINDEHEPELNKDEKVARAQDVFVVNLPTLNIHASEESEKMQKVKYKEIMIPEVLVEPAIVREKILEQIVEDASWKYTQNNLNSLRTFMSEIGFTDEEQDQVVIIHDFIESFDLGAPASDLLKRFPDVEFLKKAVKLLRQHYLVLRAGVSTFVYVQKNHVRQWVIHTRHIKRLERESMGKLIPNASRTAAKRKADNDLSDEEVPSVSKHSRVNEEGRRKPKPVKRFSDHQEVTTSSLDSQNTKEQLLVLKPCPWIRVNGSLNRRVLDKWLASILIECSAQVGCTVYSICLRYKQMHGADIMYLLEILSDLKIVELRSYKPRSIGLFTNYQELEKCKGNEFTDPQNTYVIPAGDAMLRMTTFIGDKLYRTEFV